MGILQSIFKYNIKYNIKDIFNYRNKDLLFGYEYIYTDSEVETILQNYISIIDNLIKNIENRANFNKNIIYHINGDTIDFNKDMETFELAIEELINFINNNVYNQNIVKKYQSKLLNIYNKINISNDETDYE
jgi:hypothetical protein